MEAKIDNSEDSRFFQIKLGKACVGVWIPDSSNQNIIIYTDMSTLGYGKPFRTLQEAIKTYKRRSIKEALLSLERHLLPENCIPFRKKAA